MLQKKKRLTKEDFKVIKPKIFFRGVLFDVAFAPSLDQKFACVISKKKIKTSVSRNSIKRKVLSVINELNPQKKGFFIFYIKTIPKTTSYALVKEEISKAFDTLH